VRAYLPIAIALLYACIWQPAAAADKIATSLRDAHKLVECMVAFNGACVVKRSYNEYLYRQGASADQITRNARDLYAQLKAMGAKFTRFDLAQPQTIDSSDTREFVFIPYEQVLQLKGREHQSKAYFIGVSDDHGESWRFVDGMQINEKNIRLIIPGYTGTPPLPPIYSEAPSSGS
jgi:hypothetical protein